MKNVLCIGYACVDVNYQISSFPKENKKMLATDFDICGGGPASNASICVSKLGGTSSFLGYIGNDPFGNLHQEELKKSGVDISLCSPREIKTPVVCILTNSLKNERTAIAYRTQDYWIKEIPKNLIIERYDSVLFDGHQPILNDKILDFCKTKNIPTILDAGSINQGTLSILSKVDYAVVSQDFAQEFCNSKNDFFCLEKIVKTRNNKTTVVTLGSKGAIAYKDECFYEIGAFKINSIDTTGAGDAYHGAFSYFITSVSFEECLIKSAAAGALACEKLGARESIPTLKDLNSLLNSQKITCKILR